MKMTLMIALLGCQLAGAQTNFFPILRCKDRTYTNATIENITPATVDLSWGTSGVRMSITNLPAKLQARYHYNARKAREYLAQQASIKAAQQERDHEQAVETAAALNTLGPPQNIRIVKSLLFPGSIQIEIEGVLSEASIPNLPPEILAFVTKLDLAQTNAANLKENAQRLRVEADRANGIAQAVGIYDSNYQTLITQANVEQSNAREAELKSADAQAELQKLQAQAKDRTTIVARPTGKMITEHIRQWQFQGMANPSPGP